MATAPPGIGLIRYGVPARALAGRFARLSIRCTQIPYGLATPRYVRRARAAGLQVHVWTVNDPKIMAAMLDLGVDGIMTDQTEALRELMISRGQWNPAGRLDTTNCPGWRRSESAQGVGNSAGRESCPGTHRCQQGRLGA